MGALASEIRRVATLRERYRVMGPENDHYRLVTGQTLHVNVAPALVLMDAALDAAIAAADSGEALDCARALQGLREFRE
jgi:hypothetical protein